MYNCIKFQLMKFQVISVLAILLFIGGCKEKDPVKEPSLVFVMKLDPLQQRLNNFGQPASMPANHAAQTPDFKFISAHYIELAQNMLTQLGNGAVVYFADETTAGGANAINFEKAKLVKDGEEFFRIPLKDVQKGDYEYLRVSLAYQNYEVDFWLDTTISGFPVKQSFPCNVGSFVGYNNYIKSFKLNSQTVNVNANKLQGFWGAESYGTIAGINFNNVQTGQAPAGATTVVNPLAATSPIPAGSCVATGRFTGGKLSVTGNEKEDIVVEVSLSINNSFEWREVVTDGKWEPAKGENVVDMGIRGLIPTVK